MSSAAIATVFVFGAPFERIRGYRRAQGAARAGGAGTWGLCDPAFEGERR